MDLEGQSEETLPENLAHIKAELLKGQLVGSYVAPEIEGCKVEVMYDTGNEPETGTSRNDEVIIKVTENGGVIQYAKLNYYYRGRSTGGLDFITEVEAEDFIKKERAYYKTYNDEVDKAVK